MTQPKPSDAAQQASINYLRSIGKCASKSMNGRLCNITANHQGKRHKAQVLGGADDGKVLEEWDW